MPDDHASLRGGKELFVNDGAPPEIDTLLQAIGSTRTVLILDPTRDGVLQFADAGQQFRLQTQIHRSRLGLSGNPRRHPSWQSSLRTSSLDRTVAKSLICKASGYKCGKSRSILILSTTTTS